jgi:hypothetical protein
MRKLFVPAVAAAVLATSSLAFAAAVHHVSGTVKTFDSKTLTLTSGAAYILPRGFKDPGIRNGQKVSVAWEMKGHNRIVDKVTIAK